jgi:FMN phosphatase YigB (HAD superfamily)
MYILIDLGNTMIKLAYERVLANLCVDTNVGRDEMLDLLEDAGGYRDMERGAVTFPEFYEFLVEKAGYRGGIRKLRTVWSDFFDGTIAGMEDILDELREQHEIAFLSNSNDVHAEVIPRKFSNLFQRGDTIVYSHLLRIAKPDQAFFHRALEMIGAAPAECVFIDDLIENVRAAQAIGIRSFQFVDAVTLKAELQAAGVL